ncbi:MAG: helical backbone metal receptor [Ilumatobacteraceae bacterium]
MSGLRVVSLVPSVTETLLAWGIDVVGCTRFCEQPQLPHVGGTKDPDVDAIVALSPDLVVVDEEENRFPDAEAIIARGLQLHVTHVTRLADVPATLAALATAVGADAVPVALPPAAVRHAEACVLIWRRPWMTVNADTYGSTVLDHLGIGNVFADAQDRYPTVTIEEIEAQAPALVLLPTEPYAFKQRHVDELRAALPAADVRLIDGADLFWWGVRTPEALRRLSVELTGP